MRIPVIRGVIERRLLINFRVDPDVLAATLPVPFRPKLAGGFGMVGICLIRLARVRPKGWPAWLGIGSENAAHRTAVVWDGGEGVYIRRRDTSSRLNAIAGGRIFPGVHHHARFTANETADRISVTLTSDDGETSVAVSGKVADRLPASSIFGSVTEASEFFRVGSLGYSPTRDGRLQGLELRCDNWAVQALDVDQVRSSYFDDQSIFPKESIAYDCTLLMRDIHHEWHGRPDLCCETTVAVPRSPALPLR
jgi:uncharacterized protein YqjF (DUF2071 family)